MENFSTRRQFLFIPYTMDAKEFENLDKYLSVLSKSGIREILKVPEKHGINLGGRPRYNLFDLFATMLYGFAYDVGSLRDLEKRCKFDARYIYLMQGECPSYVVFGNFFNDYVVPNRDEVFSLVTKAILKECDIPLTDVFVDGTKIEANANKYKFVWKPTSFHKKLCEKVRRLLNQNGFDDDIPKTDIFSSEFIAKKLSSFYCLVQDQEDEKTKNKLLKQYNLLSDYLKKAIEYEEKENICGPNRNSYYKTDHDATAMTLKTDYYAGLGSNMHAAYNVQAVVVKGFVCAYYISQSRNDLKDFIPVMKKFYDAYSFYPKNVCADSGYGSLENYKFLHENGIGNFLKYQSWQGNVSGLNPDRFRVNEDETITCLNNKIGHLYSGGGRHQRFANSRFYKITGCSKCEFKYYCKRWQKKKSENFKIFEVNVDLYKYKQEAETNLLSSKGIEMRVNRSAQMEGSYGVLKQDMHYVRFRRITLNKTGAEFMFTFLGYNLRKLFHYFEGTLKTDYWHAPDNLKVEKFKKPSAKKLTNRINKKKVKNLNTEAKRKYKYKKKRGSKNL